MNEARWTAVDDYLSGLLVPPDAALDAALQASAAAGLPPINVAPNQGRLLQILVRAVGARMILEIGTLGGYSTEIARANLARAGLADVVEVRVGKALETLPRLAAEGAGPFDLVFVDADKPNNAAYFDWALRLARPGSLIVVDNVVRDGKVIDGDDEDRTIQGVRRFLERLGSEPRVLATALQTVGSKGYDGLAVAIVVSDT
jgi:predicted O-methyltransferase YrrM